MVCQQVNRVTIPCLFLVRLHCGPVVDFTTLHPFDFDRNLFYFLVCVLFHFSEVQFNIIHVLSRLCHGFHHWFSFPVVDGFSLLLTILNLYM